MAKAEYPRASERIIRRDLGIYPVVAVMGARQVGKSTLCRKIAHDHDLAVCTLDDADYLRKAVETPEVLLDELGLSAFIDEAQRAPGLFLAMKAVVDREQRPGAYLLSGSNQPRMSGEVGDSLLGRAAYRTLRPLTLSELRLNESHPGWSFLFDEDDSAVLAELEARANSSGELDWRDIVRTGGYPRALAAPEDYRSQILNDYIDVFTNRDIREVISVESPERFERFFRLVCAWTGQELNAAAISRDLGIPVNTVRRWIDALERSFLIELIQPYSRNASQRVINAPKIFVVDPALALAGARETEPTGFHLETLACIDLLTWRDESPSRALYHWRLAGGQEVDFILQENQQLLPVEIKATSDSRSRNAKHLRTFRERHSNTPRGLLLTCDPQITQLDGGIIAAPWWAVI
ncbi:MAG: ATP-binding protein [Gemmatimonadota bacterium]